MSIKKKTPATNEDGKPAMVPKLRFPEFRAAGAWEETRLGRLGKLISGLTYSPDDVRASGLLVLRSSNVQNSEIALDDCVYVDLSMKRANLSQPNDILICVRNGSKALIGKCALIPEGIPTCTHGAFMTVFRAETPSFIFQLFQTNRYQKQVAGDLGATINSINGSQLLKYDFFIPRIREQQKIAECLSSVDELIAAQTRKVDALKTHKKGLMQQLFPREGETQPRLRFPEFQNEGEWEVKRLDKLVDIQSGSTPSKANPAFWNGSVPWVSAKDMKRLFLTDAEDHISAAAVDDGARLVAPGTLLMLTRGMTLLKDVPICVLRCEMSFNQDVKGLRPKGGVEGLFLAWMLLGNKSRLLAMVKIAGHGTGKLDTEELKSLELKLPAAAEQQRIADCLTSLDDLIAAQTQMLEGLKTHKKGLMQQLFPTENLEVGSES